MVTMAKKAKKVRNEVIVRAEQVAGDQSGDSDQEKVKPSKKIKKKKTEPSVTSETTQKENATINGSSEGPAVKEEKLKVEEKSSTKSPKERMKADYSYISSFLGAIHIPHHKRLEDGLLDVTKEDGETLEEKQRRVRPGDTTRAATREELKERLQTKLEELRANINVNDKKKEKKLKKRLARIEKTKRETNELKQKMMSLGKSVGKKGNLLKASESAGALPKSKGVKTEKGVVFSKFDFKDDLTPKEVKKSADPQAALNKLKKEKEKIKMWEEKGRTEKASKIENSIAWDKAINKAQGEKVKDDVGLLKKSIKKQKQIKSSSKKKWEKRSEEVKNKETAFVEKREGNMAKRKKDVKDRKMKKLAAKGRHVPGF